MTDKQFYILIGIGALGLLFIKSKAEKVVEAVNPFDRDNIFHTSVNRALSDDPNFSIGSWVYDLFNDDPEL